MYMISLTLPVSAIFQMTTCQTPYIVTNYGVLNEF